MYDDHTRRAISHPLAMALLAGPWTHMAMADRVRRTLDGRVRWIDWLVGEVLDAYHRPPLDRPRELAAYVELVLAERRSRATRSPGVRRYALPESRMVTRRWSVPVLHDVGELCNWLDLELEALQWFADVRSWERRHPDGPLRHYRYAAIPKRSGGVRLLEAPKPRLKALQRRLLHELLAPIPAHPAAHGFVAGRSVRTHAAAHTGRRLVVRFDLEDCFASITAGRVFGTLRLAGYPEGVAHALTGLMTNAAPSDALGPTPTDGDPSRAMAHRRLRDRLAVPHLPQGAPTSPTLANLVLFSLDRRLTGLASSLDATYTRYADDLAFSGGPRLQASLPTLRLAVADIVRSEGLRVREDKTAVMTSAGRQRLCGVVVNVTPNLPRAEYDRLKAAVHAVTTSRRTADAELMGQLSWLSAVHPAHGAKLRARLDQAARGGGRRAAP